MISIENESWAEATPWRSEFDGDIWRIGSKVRILDLGMGPLGESITKVSFQTQLSSSSFYGFMFSESSAQDIHGGNDLGIGAGSIPHFDRSFHSGFGNFVVEGKFFLWMFLNNKFADGESFRTIT